MSKSYSFAGFLAAVVYAWGLVSSLLYCYSVDLPFFAVIFYILLILSAMHLIFLNKISIITFSSAAAFTALVYFLNFEVLNNALTPFVTRIYQFLTETTRSTKVDSREIGFLFALTVTVPVFFSAGRLRGPWFLLISAAAVFFTEWELGYRNIFPQLCACAAVIAAVHTASRARFLTHETYESADGSEPRASRTLALYILPVFFITAALCSAFMPSDAYSFHSTPVETVFDDIADAFGHSIGFTRSHTVFSLSDYGYPGELGGPAALSGAEVFSITAPAPALLRAAVKDIYTGSGWEKSEGVSRLRFDSPLFDSQRAEVFGEGKPESVIFPPGGRFSRTAEITVTLLSRTPSTVMLTGGKPLEITSSAPDFVPYFDSRGEIFSKRPLYYGQSYTVLDEQPDFTDPYFAATVLEFERQISRRNEYRLIPDAGYREAAALYTGLPSGLSGKMISLARSLTADIESPFEQCMAIRSFLSDYCEYTLTPQPVPAGAEFVEWFIDTREGYCTYYATAMTIFARINGIPARYVEGFTLFTIAPDEDGVYTVTGEQAHAWCEVYLEGIGWIPFDATASYPAFIPGSNTIFGESSISYVPEFAPQTPSPEEFYPPDANPEPSSEELPPSADSAHDAEPETPISIYVYVIAAFIPLALVVLAAFFTVKLIRRGFRPEFILKKMNPSDALLFYWRDILMMLSCMQLEPEPGESASRFGSRINSKVYAETCSMTYICGLVETCVYASAEPNHEKLSAMQSFHRELDAKFLRSLRPHRYIARRILSKRAQEPGIVDAQLNDVLY